ncbi:MAG: hypothetical protein JJE28_08140 [Actinomycetales bacterium]|nr:hypothetical protein [Actinomycetales bacterium]
MNRLTLSERPNLTGLSACPRARIVGRRGGVAIAIAIRRSLAKATAWRDYDWQIIHSKAVSPVTHMALDEVLANEVGPPTQPDQSLPC